MYVQPLYIETLTGCCNDWILKINLEEFQACKGTITAKYKKKSSIFSGYNEEKVSPMDGMLQVYVPEGIFLMGSTSADYLAVGDEFPQREIVLSAYWLDAYEVTNAQ